MSKRLKTTPFLYKDLRLIEVALRLRIESCEDNEDIKGAKKWRIVHTKVTSAIHEYEGE